VARRHANGRLLAVAWGPTGTPSRRIARGGRGGPQGERPPPSLWGGAGANAAAAVATADRHKGYQAELGEVPEVRRRVARHWKSGDAGCGTWPFRARQRSEHGTPVAQKPTAPCGASATLERFSAPLKKAKPWLWIPPTCARAAAAAVLRSGRQPAGHGRGNGAAHPHRRRQPASQASCCLLKSSLCPQHPCRRHPAPQRSRRGCITARSPHPPPPRRRRDRRDASAGVRRRGDGGGVGALTRREAATRSPLRTGNRPRPQRRPTASRGRSGRPLSAYPPPPPLPPAPRRSAPPPPPVPLVAPRWRRRTRASPTRPAAACFSPLGG